MTPRNLCPRALLAICAATLSCLAQDGGGGLGSIPIPGGRLELRRDGGYALVQGERAWVRRARLTIAGEGWRGSVDQGAMQAAEGFPRREGAAYAFRGTVVEPVAGVTWTLEQRVEPVEGGVRVDYAATPERDGAISEVCVFLDLPVAEWSGRPVLLWPSEEGTFPAQAPQRRHFLSGATRRAALGAAGPERLSLAFASATLCTVQDAREFGSDCYQIYPRLFVGTQVRGGTTYRLGLTFLPGDATPLAMPRLTLESRGQPGFGALRVPSAAVPQFGRFEVHFEANGTWDNPYDPDQVAIDALVRTPGDRQVTVPAFFRPVQ